MKTIWISIAHNLFSLMLVLSGAALRHWINYRRIKRINSAGVSVFANYGQKVVFKFLEKWARRFGLLLILLGLLLWLIHYCSSQG